MKVNGIELLQMIKDKKVPYNTLIDVSGGTNLMHPNMSLHEDNSLYWEWANGSQIVLTNDLLEYNFEIIELTEEIEELGWVEIGNETGMIRVPSNEELRTKINELVREVNNLKDKINN